MNVLDILILDMDNVEQYKLDYKSTFFLPLSLHILEILRNAILALFLNIRNIMT